MLNEFKPAVFKHQGVALYVADFKLHWILTSVNPRFVCVGKVPHKAVVIEFQIIIIEGLGKDSPCAVWRGHHEINALDVVAAKGVSNINRELHVTELRAVIRRPFSHFWVKETATGLVDFHDRIGEGVCLHLKF